MRAGPNSRVAQSGQYGTVSDGSSSVTFSRQRSLGLSQGRRHSIQAICRAPRAASTDVRVTCGSMVLLLSTNTVSAANTYFGTRTVENSWTLVQFWSKRRWVCRERLPCGWAVGLTLSDCDRDVQGLWKVWISWKTCCRRALPSFGGFSTPVFWLILGRQTAARCISMNVLTLAASGADRTWVADRDRNRHGRGF